MISDFAVETAELIQLTVASHQCDFEPACLSQLRCGAADVAGAEAGTEVGNEADTEVGTEVCTGAEA